ncbi:MAG TPA: hypothetical protein PLC22_11890, partial [Gordonia sp. (in: high G+C Gram-positive bacteria)]|nr:hypothetical protein [Gordonia sp. (in: high G+C Gram-positive bacteria)]
MARRPIDVAALTEGVLADRRSDLARAITLIESNRPEHHQQAQDVLQGVLHRTGAHRRCHLLWQCGT